LRRRLRLTLQCLSLKPPAQSLRVTRGIKLESCTGRTNVWLCTKYMPNPAMRSRKPHWPCKEVFGERRWRVRRRGYGVGSGGGTQARHAARASGVQLCEGGGAVFREVRGRVGLLKEHTYGCVRREAAAGKGQSRRLKRAGARRHPVQKVALTQQPTPAQQGCGQGGYVLSLVPSSA